MTISEWHLTVRLVSDIIVNTRQRRKRRFSLRRQHRPSCGQSLLRPHGRLASVLVAAGEDAAELGQVLLPLNDVGLLISEGCLGLGCSVDDVTRGELLEFGTHWVELVVVA